MFRLILIVVAALSVSCSSTKSWSTRATSGSYIVISKEGMQLTLYSEQGSVVHQFPIACGAAYGDKTKSGDMKTPEGEFSISELKDASAWTHDFGDGKGEVKGAYGAHFIRLATPPHTGIGIHGTHDAKSIGTRASEGCVRLRNRNLNRLVRYVYLGMPVIISPSVLDANVSVP